VEHLRLRAESAQVEHQIVPVSATAADYTRVARAANGIPCAGLAIPILGTHSAQEKFRWRALEDAISFLVSLLAEPGGLLEAAAATD
jgi:putative aminopeptidase FrvX